MIIEPTETTPNVVFDPEQRIFRISGESRPEDVRKIYGNILDWLNNYLKEYFITGTNQNEATQKDPSFTFEFNMYYFYSATSKYFLDIITFLDSYFKKGFNVKIFWYYEKTDEDNKESGEELKKYVSLPFELVLFSSESSCSS